MPNPEPQPGVPNPNVLNATNQADKVLASPHAGLSDTGKHLIVSGVASGSTITGIVVGFLTGGPAGAIFWGAVGFFVGGAAAAVTGQALDHNI